MIAATDGDSSRSQLRTFGRIRLHLIHNLAVIFRKQEKDAIGIADIEEADSDGVLRI